MTSRISLSPLLLAVILGGGFLAYLNFAPEKEQQKPAFNPTPVRAITVTEQPFALTIEALGTAQANESVVLTSRETDLVTAIHFDDGDFVKKGALLVQLDDEEERGRLRELNANLDEARRQLKRLNDLSKTNAASEQLLDEQIARVKGLEAQVEVVTAQLRNFEVRAPFAGLLGVRAISLGSLIRPADVITTLDDISRIKLDFSVAEKHLATLAVGQLVEATSVAYPGEVFSGKISSIDTRIDPISRSIKVRALIDNKDNRLRPGMLLQVILQKQQLQTIVIPEKSLVPVEDRQYVFVVEGQKVRQQQVTIGERKPGVVQILAGLDVGEQVVTEGTLRIRDKSTVRVLD